MINNTFSASNLNISGYYIRLTFFLCFVVIQTTLAQSMSILERQWPTLSKEYVMNDSLSLIRDSSSVKDETCEVNITVLPKEASDASIMLIRNSIVENKKTSMVVSYIDPDTLEVQKAPVSLLLSLGNYQFVAVKEGFRNTRGKFEIFDTNKKYVQVEMLTLKYLKGKEEQWRTIKWISAGVMAATSIASYYFSKQIDIRMIDYNTATLPSVIKDSHESVNRNQRYYRIFSAIALTTVGSTIISWLIESIYK